MDEQERLEAAKPGWEKIYDKGIRELKTNLIYVLVVVLAWCLYVTEESKNKLQLAENLRMANDRDQWRALATKAISRNFDYVDILILNNEKNFSNPDTVVNDTIR